MTEPTTQREFDEMSPTEKIEFEIAELYAAADKMEEEINMKKAIARGKRAQAKTLANVLNKIKGEKPNE